jgi:hypothetical protein
MRSRRQCLPAKASIARNTATPATQQNTIGSLEDSTHATLHEHTSLPNHPHRTLPVHGQTNQPPTTPVACVRQAMVDPWGHLVTLAESAAAVDDARLTCTRSDIVAVSGQADATLRGERLVKSAVDQVGQRRT